MVVTNDVELPEFEDLTVDEVNMSASTLMSAAPYLGKLCEPVNNEFMLCRQEGKDARACVELGKKVTGCAMEVFMGIKKYCQEEFNQYANCVDKSSGDYGYKYCRNTQHVFDECMFDKMCIERPHFGYFCRGRIHTSPLIPPPARPCPCLPQLPDSTPNLPDCKQRQAPRFGSRLYWTTE